MKLIKYAICLTLVFTTAPVFAKRTSMPFLTSSIEIVDSAEGAAILGKDLSYPELLSMFDVQARLGANAAKTDYLPVAMAHTMNWNDEETEQIKAAFTAIEAWFTDQNIRLNMPPKIFLIKSDTKQEFGAEGYTRGSSIILNTSVEGITKGLAAHELFHVFSRYNEKKRDELYSVFGFRKCNSIDLKSTAGIHSITNPDCPVVSHYVNVDGRDMTLLLYTDKNDVSGMTLPEFVRIGLLLLEGDDKHKKPMMNDGKAVIKELQDVPALFKQVGTNTDYLLHPEEICADHFAMMVTGKQVRQPELLENFKDVLAR